MIAVLPVSEARFLRDMTVYVTVFMELLIFAALFILIYILIKVLIVENIHKINKALARITNGNLDVVVDVRTNEEFSSLSDDINSTVETLKHYIDEAAARIDEELEFAKTIQTSALPSVFPPYPNRDEFEIWAEMTPAKEVGGDFYDFYLIGENRLAFIIADVSGKGIPAAMFMMTAKTLIKSLAETGLDADEIFTRANEKLCENNEAGMFVTAWMGILDLNTGIVTFANAGHNPPILRHSDGRTEYIKARSGFILAGMEGTRYRKNELQLTPGDALYLYTDGVTEAADANEMMYGEERLNKLLIELSNVGAEKICKSVKRDVDRFVNGAAQSDDMTMLCLELKSTMQSEEAKVNELTVTAVSENIEKVTDFVEEKLENTDCPLKAKTQLNIAVDEIFGNIVHYAYKNEVGSTTVRAEVTSDAVVLTFIDSGERYNPLESKDPDITLPAEEREIGGLGIYIVKQTMDEVTYEYKDGNNILKIKKCIK
jgi:sigma-B regulation protein RsbU (phosphoserine phosphatase)